MAIDLACRASSVPYLSRSVQSLPHHEEAADPGQAEVEDELTADGAHLVDAAADLQHVVARGRIRRLEISATLRDITYVDLSMT